MNNKILALATLSLLSSPTFASTLNCESYYQDAGQRVNLVLDLSQQGPTITAQLKISSSPNSVVNGFIPTKGESAMLIGETSQNRIFLSGVSKIKVAPSFTYYRKFDANISDVEFKKAGKFIIHIMSGQPSSLEDGGNAVTSMEFTCQKK